ncbi:hypothetical protein XC49_08730, partial [Clostridioides difficile]|uniref:IS3 family transposase n=1 Tax=Clostridioides difficile TaxID=1496 RepID=UPI0028A427D8
ILDLGDRSIVSYVIGKSNNNNLVFETFNKAIDDYIYYYNNFRYQKRLNSMSPLEFRKYLSTEIA